MRVNKIITSHGLLERLLYDLRFIQAYAYNGTFTSDAFNGMDFLQNMLVC